MHFIALKNSKHFEKWLFYREQHPNKNDNDNIHIRQSHYSAYTFIVFLPIVLSVAFIIAGFYYYYQNDDAGDDDDGDDDSGGGGGTAGVGVNRNENDHQSAEEENEENTTKIIIKNGIPDEYIRMTQKFT